MRYVGFSKSQIPHNHIIHFEVGLRQGCVMSPWLFNMNMDGVVER